MGRRKKIYNADKAYTFMFTKQRELFGPFSNEAAAHKWATIMKIVSYTLLSDRVRIAMLRRRIVKSPFNTTKGYNYDGKPIREVCSGRVLRPRHQ